MRLQRTCVLFPLFVVSHLTPGAARQAVEFDPGTEFSLTANPNGVWQYGYSESESLAPTQFRMDTYSETTGKVGFWHPLANHGPGAGYYPYVAFNTTNESQMGSQNGWAVRAGEIPMEASNSGQYSIVRFVTPVSGTYKVTARFAGIHFHLSTTDVHILHNAKPLFDADIEGYGGDAKFHQVEGSHPTASFTASIRLRANDTIAFAVGYGRNKTHYSDTTGLTVKIIRQP